MDNGQPKVEEEKWQMTVARIAVWRVVSCRALSSYSLTHHASWPWPWTFAYVLGVAKQHTQQARTHTRPAACLSLLFDVPVFIHTGLFFCAFLVCVLCYYFFCDLLKCALLRKLAPSFFYMHPPVLPFALLHLHSVFFMLVV